MKMRTLVLGTVLSVLLTAWSQAATVLVEAESFAQRGGWALDTQLMDTMGSPYLLAHGLGCPVANATTTVRFPETGEYRVFVRTKDWVARWNATGAPGKFQLLIDGKPLKETFGTKGAEWFWHDAGTVKISKREVSLALRDLTGFEGRCDAIVFSNDPDFTPPNDLKALTTFRRKALGLPEDPDEAGEFDIVVIGGGPGGCCTAVTAARMGLNVALIQDRAVLGGNNSSEVRVGVSGSTRLPPYPILGEVLNEWRPIGYWNFWRAERFPDEPGSKEILEAAKKNLDQFVHIKAHNAAPMSKYQDDKKMGVVRAEKNLHLFLNQHAFKVQKHGNRITAVIAKHTQNGKETRFRAPLFVDCTGDGTIGYLAGADYEMTKKDTMGSSNMWRIADVGEVSTFPRCPWALDLTDKPFPSRRDKLGNWRWESGFNKNTIKDVESIRDHNFRAMYGAWDCLKNVRNRYRNSRLVWAAYISGKRESRRLLGDVVLTMEHILQGKIFSDGCVATDWGFDLHYPDEKYAKGFEGNEFISRSEAPAAFKGTHTSKVGRRKHHYMVPYRCLYSRNIDNLMMAGRDISVTHNVLGTVRVKGTIGMMGEVLGRAAYLCKKHKVGPRGVYEKHLDELKKLFQQSTKRKT